MSPRSKAATRVDDMGACPTCGKRRYTTRRLAKRAGQLLWPSKAHHFSAYVCDGYWHYGHMPPQVLRGTTPRENDFVRALRARKD